LPEAQSAQAGVGRRTVPWEQIPEQPARLPHTAVFHPKALVLVLAMDERDQTIAAIHLYDVLCEDAVVAEPPVAGHGRVHCEWSRDSSALIAPQGYGCQERVVEGPALVGKIPLASPDRLWASARKGRVERRLKHRVWFLF